MRADPAEILEVQTTISNATKEIVRLEKILEKQEDEGVYDETLYSKLDELTARRDKAQRELRELENRI